MKYCFDLDGTLCTNTNGKYEEAQPFDERIKIVNKLYNEGHRVYIDSARGSASGLDWHGVTEEQLLRWGVKYHTLRTGFKLEADVYIDDKGCQDSIFFKKEE